MLLLIFILLILSSNIKFYITIYAQLFWGTREIKKRKTNLSGDYLDRPCHSPTNLKEQPSTIDMQ